MPIIFVSLVIFAFLLNNLNLFVINSKLPALRPPDHGMMKTSINKENIPKNYGYICQKTQNINISKPFYSIPMINDPSSNPSYNFIDPLYCSQPFLTETTILDKVLPTLNPHINISKKVDSEKQRNKDQMNKSSSFKKKDGILKTPAKTAQKNVTFQESPCVIMNGNRVSINRKNLFDEADCKQSGIIEIPKDFTKEMKLQDFELGKALGKGRFGSVFLVRHKQTNAIFALKMVNKELAKEEKVFDLIQREAKIQESLDHPNILKCYGSFEDNTRFYLVLEYVLDGDLYSTMKKQPNKRFSEEDASQILYQLLVALKYLKERLILHRDIKAENIMNSMGVFKLSDFGWSIFNKENSTRKTFCGTVEYVAPEMIMNESYNDSVDVWAVAVLIYELVNGEPPFSTANSIDTFSLILDVNFKMPEFFSDELKDFIGKILVKDVTKRMGVYEAMEHPFITKYNSK